MDPVAALNPGLIYDLAVEDYLSFLCAMHYRTEDIKKTTHRDVTCDSSKNYSVGDFNYPSFGVGILPSGQGFGIGGSTTVKYTRTLTNVGTPTKYKVSVSTKSPSVNILIVPKSLSFSKLYEKKNYTVTFVVSSMPSGTTRFARLERKL